jgi:hypothetical protein
LLAKAKHSLRFSKIIIEILIISILLYFFYVKEVEQQPKRRKTRLFMYGGRCLGIFIMFTSPHDLQWHVFFLFPFDLLPPDYFALTPLSGTSALYFFFSSFPFHEPLTTFMDVARIGFLQNDQFKILCLAKLLEGFFSFFILLETRSVTKVLLKEDLLQRSSWQVPQDTFLITPDGIR